MAGPARHAFAAAMVENGGAQASRINDLAGAMVLTRRH
jgi:hypothetical protein